MKKIILCIGISLMLPLGSNVEAIVGSQGVSGQVDASGGVANEDILLTNSLVTIIYEKDLRTSITYVYKGTELKPLEDYGDKVKVKLYDKEGYVRKNDVTILSADQVKGRSYYKVVKGDLLHYVYSNDTNRYNYYIYGPAIKGMDEGVKYYSWDGIDFQNGVEGYNYFNYMPLYVPTSYTAEELDSYIKSAKPDSTLIGAGKHFKRAEEEYGVNALYLLSHAIHESYWGLSRIALEKNNLFGINAVDSDAYGKASEYDSFKDSIHYAAYFVKTRYLDSQEKTPFYKGAVLGNKSVGMNIYYASDPYWGQKIAGRMYGIDKFLGGEEWGVHRLGISLVDNLNVRSAADIGSGVQYKYNKGYGLLIMDEFKDDGDVWYKVKSDHSNYDEAFVYADGKLGEYVSEINNYESIQIKDNKEANLKAKVLVNHLNVRRGATINSGKLFQLNENDTLVVLDIVENEQGKWFKFSTEKHKNGFGYVYANGDFGTYAKIMENYINDKEEEINIVEEKDKAREVLSAKVLVNNLNVRKKATTNSKRLSQINEGDVLEVLDVIENEQGTWLKFNDGEQDVAYVYSNGKLGTYVELIKGQGKDAKTENVVAKEPKRAKVLVNNLNVREEANANSERLYQLNKDEVVLVQDVIENKQGIWFKFMSEEGSYAYIYANGKFGHFVKAE